MNPNQALWEKGDFGEIADTMRPSGDALVASLGVTSAMRVLDLGCGDGTTALPMAAIGADVVGIDIARNLIARAQRRAGEAQLHNVTFAHGDACDLHGVPDRSFDLVLSMFGAMFAPKPFDAAREMVRVTKPGGRIVMGNWIPNDPTSFVSLQFAITSAYAPPPLEGFVSPMLWGVEQHIVDRFEKAGVAAERISMERDTWRFGMPDRTPNAFVDHLRKHFAPAMVAFESAEAAGRANELYAKLVELATAQNQTPGSGVSIAASFMRVTVRL